MIDSNVLGLTESEKLPELESVEERVAWLLGRMMGQVPMVARPIIRSMLLPRLEQLPSEHLIETLGILQEQILPWLIGDNSGAAESREDPEHEGQWTFGTDDVQGQEGREVPVPGSDGVGQDDSS